MLQPKKTKYRKQRRGRSALVGSAKGGTRLSFGSFGIKAITPAEITSRQIEAARKAINNHLSRKGKLWIKIFPHKPLTKKGDEASMGSGKGSIDGYVAVVKRGVVLFELEGVSEELARGAFNKAIYKLPCKTRFVKKEF
ncbi:50S ribosomal protein L16 [Candidatus Gracilibacteria bacterium]|nr:50S ribosomal protein L16 [Candidatus Gracilibacteria bacterium]